MKLNPHSVQLMTWPMPILTSFSLFLFWILYERGLHFVMPGYHLDFDFKIFSEAMELKRLPQSITFRTECQFVGQPWSYS